MKDLRERCNNLLMSLDHVYGPNDADLALAEAFAREIESAAHLRGRNEALEEAAKVAKGYIGLEPVVKDILALAAEGKENG
jgi:hypothetical protein